jgi:hypothetical protein
MSRPTLLFLAAAAAILAAAPAIAQEQNTSLYHKFEISPSVTSAILNSNIRVDSESGAGTDVDAEDDLGLQTVRWEPRIMARWRPGRHHEIEGGYQFARRNNEHQLERTITVRDTTFDAGLNVKTHLNTDIAYLNYRYAIIAKDRTQAGIGLGLGALPFKFGIDALASAGSKEVTYTAGENLTVPVGALGIYGRFLLGTKFATEVDTRIVKLQIDRFDVQFVQLNAAGRYFPSPRYGFELGAGADAAKVDIGPREGANVQVSGRVKYSITNVRLGFVYVP